VVVTWRALHHQNVLPLLGVTMTENRLVMVSEWMSNGNIREFTKENANVDRLGLVCFSYKLLIPPLVTDDRTTDVVERRHKGIDLYA